MLRPWAQQARQPTSRRGTVAHLRNRGCCVHIHTGNLSAPARYLENDELVAAGGAADVLLARRHGADHLVAEDLGHLRRPLAGAAANTGGGGGAG